MNIIYDEIIPLVEINLKQYTRSKELMKKYMLMLEEMNNYLEEFGLYPNQAIKGIVIDYKDNKSPQQLYNYKIENIEMLISKHKNIIIQVDNYLSILEKEEKEIIKERYFDGLYLDTIAKIHCTTRTPLTNRIKRILLKIAVNIS